LTEQGLTSYQTHYRSYRGRFLQVIWPNQQRQSTEGNQNCSYESAADCEHCVTQPSTEQLW